MKFLFNNTRYFFIFLLFLFLIGTRFIGLDWGLPFPMHPDERNMVVAINQLSCAEFGTTECFNPHFFAYGQFTLYLAYILAPFISLIYEGTSFEHAALALRFISATSSILTVVILLTILKRLIQLQNKALYAAVLFFTSVPAFVQFSHFGTTESVLMLFYTMLLYFAVRLLKEEILVSSFTRYSAVTFGIALGTKVSALAFGAIPAVALIMYAIHKWEWRVFVQIMFEGAKFLIIAGAFFVITSPYNMIAFDEFRGSMQYESAVGLGEYKAFYTRQFEYTIPLLFQFISIFPYSLGWSVLILFILGFFFLPLNAPYNFLRIQFLLFFIPNSLFYAKWSRFSSPLFPLMVLIAFLMLIKLYALMKKYIPIKIIPQVTVICVMIAAIIPGVAYTTIYATQDVRFKASEWVFENMPEDSYILSETANVIDVPVVDPDNQKLVEGAKPYKYISFNFYDLHILNELSQELESHINEADYIFIPSRRVFANHTCYVPGVNDTFTIQDRWLVYESDRCTKLRNEYPEVNTYYDRLFSGGMGFQQIAEFTSYPRIELFGYTLIEFPDEQAEETWTVFDHPVIRIYKRI